MEDMNNGISILGGVIAVMTVAVYGDQNSAPAPVSNSAFAEAVSTTTALADTSTASSTAVTLTATDLTSSTVTFHGAVYPHEGEITYWFEYSADPLLGLILIRKTSRVSLVTSSGQKLVEANVSGLMKSTKYYFRIVTEGSSGMVRGDTVSFNTH